MTRCFCVLLLMLSLAWPVRAQPTCVTTPNPANCPFPFDVVDEYNVPVTSLCVGKPVKFQPCSSRNPSIYNNTIYYGVRRGLGATFANSTPIGCTPDHIYPYFYTPTLAEVGPVTVSELTNENGVSKYFIRELRVYDSTPPTFTITPCPTGSAKLTVTDPKFATYEYLVGGPGGPTGSLTYNQPQVVTVPAGTTTITVTGHHYPVAPDACDGVNTQTIPALAAPVPPLLTSLTLTGPLPGGPVTLAVGGLPPGYRYAIQLADANGVFSDVMAVQAGTPSVTLLTPIARGCYRLYREDLCGGNQQGSLPICTLSLSGTSSNNRNQLLLDDAGSGNNYTVTRNGQPYTTFTSIPGGLEDANVQCGTTYRYVVSRQQGGGVAVSNEFRIPTVSALPPQRPLLLASFNGRNVVELTPLPNPPALPAGDSLHYTRTVGGLRAPFGTAAILRGPRDSTALDELRRQPPCYGVSLLNVCRIASPESAPACPTLLTATAAGSDKMAASLSWTPFGGPDPNQPASFVLQRLAADGSILSSQPVGGLSFLDLTPPADRQTLRYRLQIAGAGLPPGTFSYSNIDGFVRPISLAIPTAFTPNGDGLNDVFEVKGRFVRDYTLVVVDRNGQEVFRGTQRSDVWDGRIGSHAPVLGTYAWRYQQASEDGKTFSATGAVTILK
ncbi:MAG: gliding motility-associated C-terminal domain-containing protein [Bacteroidota bacterium]|nr:gliding motility-associated C-terminal domain-containing protein [Bacteroidota bacterium]